MCRQLHSWLDTSVIQDATERRQVDLIQRSLIATLCGGLLLFPFALTTGGPMIATQLLALGILVVVVGALGGLYLLRKNRLQEAVIVGVFGITASISLALIAIGPARAYFLIFGFALPLALVALLPDRRALLITAFLITLSIVGLIVIEDRWPDLIGYFPDPGVPLVHQVAVMLTMLWLLVIFLDRSGVTLRQSIAELQQTNQRLEIELEERRHAELLLRESEARYRRLAENAPDVIYRYRLREPEGYEYISPLVTEMFGYTPEEHYADSTIWHRQLHPEDVSTMERFLDMSPVLPRATSMRIIHRNGAIVWVEIRETPDYDMFGQLIAVEGVARDITERMRLTTQLIQSQKMESIGRLAGGIAHDFNNLLVVISGSAEIVLEDLLPDSPLRVDVQEITHAATRAAELTHQLLGFARRQIYAPQVINLNELIVRMNRMLARLVGEHIEMVTLTGEQLWSVMADPGQIEQVLTNLVVNACDAMPEGGCLTVATTNIVLDDSFAQEHLNVAAGPYVLLSVSDTGHGMSEEVRRQAFEPFFTTKPVGQGTGLGLATCYGIIKQSGGTIWIYSEPGQGTSIKIYLPSVDTAPVDLTMLTTAALPRGSEVILIVEDSLSVRAITARLLRAQGYTVLEAANGEAALHLAQQTPFTIDLLLTDVIMPRIGGRELAEQMIAQRPRLKVMFASGYAESALAHQGWLHANIAFLAKPFTSGDLARKVRETLDSER